MKLTFKNIILLAFMVPMTCGAAVLWEKTPHGVKARVDSTDIEMTFYTPAAVRVVKTPAGKAITDTSLSVVARPADVRFTATQSGNKVSLRSDDVTASLDLKTGEIQFSSRKGKSLLREKGNAIFAPVIDAGEPSMSVRQAFVLDKEEPIYGLGNLEHGNLSQRGVDRKLMPGNVEDGIPVFQSAKGYGVIWDNYSPTQFTDTPASTSFESEVGQGVDYYFMYGGNSDGVIAQIRELTGDVPMFPLWTYGFWQSRERYKSQDEITEVVHKYREQGVPLDGIIQDWQYWGNNYLWNAMEFMSPDFTNPKAMMDDIHSNNAHAIISIWSSFGPMTKQYRELDSKGLLFKIETWPQSGISHMWPPRMDYASGVSVYNCYSPEARDIYWNNLKRLYDLDLDGWWMDSTEPDHYNATKEDFDIQTGMGSWRKVRNAYPLMTVGGVYDHQRAAGSDKRVFILTRSGYTGQQRYGCNVWTGDVQSTWNNLRSQVPAALNFSMTGNPHVNSDIGGFFCGMYNVNGVPAYKNPAFQELYVRWLQFGLFSPMMRSHGTDAYREIYYFGKAGEPVYDAIADAIRLRYRLLPYIYSTAWDVCHNRSSFMRPLVMDFPADKACLTRADEFMFGQELLAAPVLEARYTAEQQSDRDENTGWDKNDNNSSEISSVDFTAPVTADVYLPKGAKWYDFFTGKVYNGGQSIVIPADISTIPLFVKAGSILPLGPDVQYATEKPWDNLNIIVYPGKSGQFDLYEDENDNYNYEKGIYSTIRFSWDDKTRTLTIADRKGEFPGMQEQRTFSITAADKPGNAVSAEYSGKEIKIKL